jgi:hypothetical protein
MTRNDSGCNHVREQNINNSGIDVALPGGEEQQTKVRIRELNDRLRKTGRGGIVLMTNGIAALGLERVNAIFAAIARFDAFTPDSDPWAEHDCASLKVSDINVLWKIDYYDRDRQFHSPDPSDPKVTVRVLTVMRSDEY